MKSALNEFALFGGSPTFPEPLHVGRPNIGSEARLFERVRDALGRRWLTNDGPLVAEFEDRLAQILHVRNCIAVCNATLGLEVAVRALGLTGEVIVPSFTFVATVHALSWLGLEPIFCDVNASTHNIDPQRVEELITPRTSGIVGVHTWGRACETAELEEIACRHGIKLIFDAAQAFGCSHNQEMIGSFGDAEVFSFHATKVVNAFEGGAIVTTDDTLADKLRLMRNFGFAGTDTVVSIGTNAKMNEMSAAMGITSLESKDIFIETNRRNYLHYLELLKDVPGITVLHYKPDEYYNFQYIVLEIEQEILGLSRDVLLAALQAEGILARRYFFPGCHQMAPYCSRGQNELPQTQRLAQRVLQLPTGTATGATQIAEICRIIQLLASNAPAIRKRLATRDTAASKSA